MSQRGVGCFDGDHPHVVIARRRPINRDDRPGAEGLLTLWVCPVLHTLGALWETYERDPRSGLGPGGPLP